MKCTQDSPAQSLLEFMDMASDAVKCALKKPTTFKRNVNHRRYLQRQVNTVVRNRRSSRKVNACDLREDVQDLVREAIRELKFSSCYANAFTDAFPHGRRNPPPPPIRANFPNSRNLNSTYRLTHLPLSKPQTPHSDPFHSNALPNNQSCLYSEVSVTSNTEDDYFMSGEELTHNIDINDLYIPELHEPRSPIVNCEDYFLENELEIPSPMHEEQSGNLHFQFDNKSCCLGRS